jgi:uncharacterized protein
MTTTTLTTERPAQNERPASLMSMRVLPYVAVLMRFPLIMLGNLLWWIGLRAVGNPDPLNNALMWSNVHIVIITDVLSLAFLVWAVRREGVSLRSLFGFERTRIIKDVLLGLGVFVILLITMYASNLILMLVMMGPEAFQAPDMSQITRASLPPLWYFLWGLIVLPISVGIVEEMVYRGYAQPRLEALIGNRWLALLVMAVGFGFQHIAFAFTDPQAALMRFIGTFVAGIVFGLLYMKMRRLLPLIIGHWLVDVIGLGLFPLLLYLSLS